MIDDGGAPARLTPTLVRGVADPVHHAWDALCGRPHARPTTLSMHRAPDLATVEALVAADFFAELRSLTLPRRVLGPYIDRAIVQRVLDAAPRLEVLHLGDTAGDHPLSHPGVRAVHLVSTAPWGVFDLPVVRDAPALHLTLDDPRAFDALPPSLPNLTTLSVVVARPRRDFERRLRAYAEHLEALEIRATEGPLALGAALSGGWPRLSRLTLGAYGTLTGRPDGVIDLDGWQPDPLAELTLYRVELDARWLAPLCAGLERLDVDTEGDAAPLRAALAHAPRLRALAVRQFIGPDGGLDGLLDGCSRLESLALNGVRGDADATAAIAGCVDLERLSVGGGVDADALWRAIESLDALRVLSAGVTPSEDTLLDRLPRHLTHIDLSHSWPERAWLGLTLERAAGPHVRLLALEKCGLDDTAPLPSLFPRLEALDLSRAYGVVDDHLIGLEETLCDLRIDNDDDQIGEEEAPRVAAWLTTRTFPRLERLHLGDCVPFEVLAPWLRARRAPQLSDLRCWGDRDAARAYVSDPDAHMLGRLGGCFLGCATNPAGRPWPRTQT